ncbi:MAG: divalent-cation tolerance protein CutA [Planctomycetota bacterium]|jgi:periplasmic divalent cation tolerance protein
MSDARVLLCTAPPEQAESVARALLERRLVACVNIVPGARSLYWWQGKLEDERESLLILKTTADRVDRLIEALKDVHPYDTPELVSLPVEKGNPPYLDWLRGEL